MKSIKGFLDGHSVAADVRMQRQIHKGAFALVEGITDLKRFQKLFGDPACCIVICHSKRNVVDAIDRLYDEGFQGALGFADADFDRITGTHVDHEGILLSRTHDFDLDIACTGALNRYFVEVCEEHKLGAFGGTIGAVQRMLAMLRPLSALRYANQRHGLK
jgi:hypothetical protein